MTTPITGAAAATGGTATASVDRADQFDNQTFLKLLVAQMQYQDPDNPADSSQIMSQTAAFSQVQSLEQIAQQNTQLLALQQALSAGALAGRSVSYTDTDGTTKTGTVTSVRISTADNTTKAMIDGNPVDIGRITEVGLPAS